MTRDEALEKIKKCLALAASPEAHEAAAALRQAQKLMVQFGLTEADVTLADVCEVRQKAQNAPLVGWEAALAHLVARAFGCDFFTVAGLTLSQSLQVRRQRYYMFVGVGSAPEVAGYAFDVLARQCARDRRRYIGLQSKNCKAKTKVARGDLYAEGWIAGMRDKLGQFAGNARDDALIAQYLEHHHSGMVDSAIKDRTKGKNVTNNDWHQGQKAGRNAELNNGLGGAAPQALIERN